MHCAVALLAHTVMQPCFSLSGWSCVHFFMAFAASIKYPAAPRYLHIMQISQSFCKSQKYTITPFSHNLENIVSGMFAGGTYCVR